MILQPKNDAIPTPTIGVSRYSMEDYIVLGSGGQTGHSLPEQLNMDLEDSTCSLNTVNTGKNRIRPLGDSDSSRNVSGTLYSGDNQRRRGFSIDIENVWASREVDPAPTAGQTHELPA